MIKHILLLLTLTTSILFSNDLLEVTLEANATKNNPLHINLTLTNISDHTIQFDESTFLSMKKHVTRDMFTVQEDGESIPYNGVLILNKSLYRSLAAGETYSTQMSLGKHYKPKKGTHLYDIVYSDSIGITEHNETKLITLTSNHLEIEKDIKKAKIKKPRVASSRRATCSSNARSILSADLYRARGYAQKSVQLLQSGGYNHSLYKHWFGAGTSGRLHQVYTNFKNIYNATFQNVQFICQSNSNSNCAKAYAFVYPNQPYNINICPSYFNLNGGASSRSNTIVHELSHFSNVADTDDFRAEKYGGSEKLAREYPYLAIRNAYSYGNYARYAEKYIGGGGNASATKWTTGAYSNNQDISKTLSISGASTLTVRVSGSTESNYDFIYIYNASGQVVKKLHGNINTTFTVSGSSIRARLKSDHSITKSGVTVSISKSSGGGGGGSGASVNYEFNSNQNAQGWSYRNMIQQYSGPYGGAWYFACNRSDPQLLSPSLNLNASSIKKVQITIANNNPSAYSWLQVFWKTNAEPYFSESKSKYVKISSHGGWSTYNINMQHSKWRGTIKQIRIDPVTRGNGSWIAIDHIRFRP